MGADDAKLSLAVQVVGAAAASREVAGLGRAVADVPRAVGAANSSVKIFDSSLGQLGRTLQTVARSRLQVDTTGLTSAFQGIRSLTSELSKTGTLRLQVDGAAFTAARQQLAGIAQDARRVSLELRAVAQRPPGDSRWLVDYQTQVQALQQRVINLRRELAAAGSTRAGGGAGLPAIANLATSGRGLADLAREASLVSSVFAGASPVVGQFSGALAALSSVAPVAAAAIAVLGTNIVAIVEASRAEEAILKLNVALASVGQFSGRASADLQHYASALQATTRESDEAIIGASALIAQIGRLSGAPLKEATQAALDLSAVLGRDLQGAALLVAKAAQGQTVGLERLGIVIDEAVPPGERFAAVLAKIRDNFPNAAAQNAATLTGAIAQLKNAWSDALEVIGQPLILPLTTFAQGITLLTRDLQAMSGAASGPKTAADAVARLGDEVRKADALLGARDRVLRKFAGSNAPEEFRIELNRSNVDGVRAILASIDQEITRNHEVGVTLSDKNNVFAELRREAAAELTKKVGLDTSSVTSQLAKLDNDLQPKTIRIQAIVDDRALQASLNSLRDQSARIGFTPAGLDELQRAVDAQVAALGGKKVAVQVTPLVDSEGLATQLRDLTQRDAAVVSIRAEIEKIPALEADALKGFTSSLQKLFNDAVAENTPRGRELAEILTPLLARAKELETTRLKVVIDKPALEPLNEALSRVRELRAEFTKTLPSLVGATFSGDAATVDAALVSIAENMRALRTAGASVETLTAAFDAVRTAVKAAGDATPEEKAKVDAFLAALDREVRLGVSVQFNVEQAKRDARALAEQTIAVLRAIKADPIRIGGAQEFAAQAQDATVAAKQLQSAIEAAQGAKPEEQIAAYESLTAAIVLTQGTQSQLSKQTVTTLEAMRAALRPAVADATALRDALKLSQQFDTDIEFGDVLVASARLDELLAKLAALPRTREIEVIIKTETEKLDKLKLDNLQKQLAEIELKLAEGSKTEALQDAARLRSQLEAATLFTVEGKVNLRVLAVALRGLVPTATEAATSARNALSDGLKDVSLDAMTNAFAGAMDAMLFKTQSVTDAMKDVFKSFVSAVIQQLARFAAMQFLHFLFPNAGFLLGAPRATTSAPAAESARSGGTPSEKATPPILPQKSIVVPIEPRLIVRAAAPVEVRPRIVAAPIPATVVPAPRVTVTPFPPLRLPAPAIRIAQAAALAAITLAAPRVSVQPAAAQTIAAPQVVVAPLRPVALAPVTIAPSVTIAPRLRLELPRVSDVALDVRLAAPERIDLPAPEIRVADADPLALDAPRVRVAALAPIALSAPATRLTRQLTAVALPPPAVTIARLAAVQIAAPPVTVQQPQAVQLPAPSVAFGATDAQQLPAPDVSFQKSSAQLLPAPSVTVAPLRPLALAPVVLTPNVTVAPRLVTVDAARASRSIRIPAPVVSVQGSIPPQRLAAPQVSVTPLKPVTLAPVALAPSVTVTPRVDIQAPRVSPVTLDVSIATPDQIALPAPAVRVATLAAITMPTPPVRLAGRVPTLAVQAPQVSIGRLATVRIPTPAVAVDAARATRIAAPSVAVGQARSVRIAAPQVTVAQLAAIRTTLPRPLAAQADVTVEPKINLKIPRLAPVGLDVAIAAPERVDLPAPSAAVGRMAPVRLAAPTATVGALRAVRMQAPQATIVGRAGSIAVQRPDFRVAGAARGLVTVPAPTLALAQRARTVAVQAPEMRVGRPGAVTLGAPDVRFRQPRIAPIEVDIPISVNEPTVPTRRVGAGLTNVPREPVLTRTPVRTVATSPPTLDLRGVTSAFQVASRRLAAQTGAPRAADTALRASGLTSTTEFARQARLGATAAARRFLPRGSEVEPGSDLLSRFAPRGRLGSAVTINIETPDVRSFDQQLRRGALGDAMRKLARSGRI